MAQCKNGCLPAVDVSQISWCVLCGSNVTLQREKRIAGMLTLKNYSISPGEGWAQRLSDDTDEYKPLMAEELNQ